MDKDITPMELLKELAGAALFGLTMVFMVYWMLAL